MAVVGLIGKAIKALGDVRVIESKKKGDRLYTTFRVTTARGRIGEWMANAKIRLAALTDAPIKVRDIRTESKKKISQNVLTSDWRIVMSFPARGMGILKGLGEGTAPWGRSYL